MRLFPDLPMRHHKRCRHDLETNDPRRGGCRRFLSYEVNKTLFVEGCGMRINVT
jgi:hypothetical protein